MTKNALLNLPSPFFLGCNYWASHAGTAMWSDWRPEQVDLDFERLAAAGIEVIRVFPLWPDFQPIHNLYGGEGAHRGQRFGELRRPDDAAGRAGMSTEMMARFATLTELADKHGLKLIVGLITGWMSGRLFVPPALQGKAILTDPDAIRWQVRFVSYFVEQMKTRSAIIAWDLGNECNVMGKVSAQEQAYVWTASIANAIKAKDGSRPLLSGMHSLQAKGLWTMQDQGELTDILTTHPYPFWTPYLDYDPLTSLRPTIHATVESLLYADVSGKPCFAEEMGTMGPMVCSEEVAAAFARTSLWSQWANGLHGLLWWCANDQTRLQHAPYDWVACEGELGLLDEDGRVKPALRAMAKAAKAIAALPPLPPRRVDGVCILNSAQDHWAAALGAFMLAKQAGLEISFRFEEQALPDASFYLLPCITGVEGVPKQLWQQLLAKVHDEGATLYLSSNDGYTLDFAELTGLRVQNRRRRADEVVLTYPADSTEPLRFAPKFRLDFSVERAEVLAAEADGNPVFSKARYGRGTVYFCALPLELTVAQKEGASWPLDGQPYWHFYATLAEALDARLLRIADPHVAQTEHAAEDGSTLVVLVNHSPDARTLPLVLCDGWQVSETLHGSPALQTEAGLHLQLPANDAAVLRLRRV
jgi:hypothetical protein